MKMKLFATILLCVLMLFVTVSADEITSEYIKTENGNQYFTTSGTVTANANGFVSLLVTDGDTISVDSIMYIDQTIANSNGYFEFLNYVPKINISGAKKYKVRIGATSSTTILDGGVLEITDAILGSVDFNGFTGVSGATVTLKDSTGATIKTEAFSSDFNLSSLDEGTYTLVIKKPLFLPAVVTVNYEGIPTAVDEIEMYAGDITQDNVINLSDLTLLLEDYSSSSSAVDLNGDGTVGASDLSAMINNYGRFVEE
ncbi:MAG: hypothetical protein IKJ06_00240 [Clostridia bacterium]|nr:hypothetical protein [Clostridia bacterium]